MTREHVHLWQQVGIATVAGVPLACLLAGTLVLGDTFVSRNLSTQLAMWLSAILWITLICIAPFFQRRRAFLTTLIAAYAVAGGLFWILRP